jgi:SAM-dependent methyltransferase
MLTERSITNGQVASSRPRVTAWLGSDTCYGPSKATVRSERADKVTFSFGRNWQQFVRKYLTAKRVEQAINSLKEFLEIPDLRDRTFLDLGCGSGLFSLAAHRLGASRIVSLDVDPLATACCKYLRNSSGDPANWTVLEGSVLDKNFLARVDKADIVYAWGSLHHTGSMWQAIRNASTLVEDGGVFFLSIYNRVEGRGSSRYWLKVKRLYNQLPGFGKTALETAYLLRYGILPQLLRLRNPLTSFRNYGQGRGMNYFADMRDWLGGYPYEFASASEVFRFCNKDLGLGLINLRSTNTLATNEFLFRKQPCTTRISASAIP